MGFAFRVHGFPTMIKSKKAFALIVFLRSEIWRPAAKNPFFFRAFSVWRFFGAIPGTSHTSLDWGSEFFGGTVGSFLAKKGFVRW